MTANLPRGLRNNNPGNINFAHQPGATLETGVPAPRFARFPTMQDGIQALIDLLVKYFKEGVNTVRGIISKWAPPTENETSVYVSYVANSMRVSPESQLECSAHNLASLAQSIIHMENGEQPVMFTTLLRIAQNTSGVVAV